MKKIAAVIILVAVIASVGFGAWYLANSPVPYSSAPEAITIGTTPTMSASLIFIAEEQGWFTQNGLRVTVKTFETTLPAIAEMKKGGVDVATTTEYTIVTEVLKKESIVLIAGIDRQQTTYLVARKDRGIEKVSDLKGKKVGVVRGTIQEFYLGRFLDLGGIRLQDLVLIDLKLPEQVDALVNGSVDAVQIPNVSINQVEERLGNRATVWPSKPDQVAHIVMASTADWTARHPEAIRVSPVVEEILQGKNGPSE
ncbi:MAG: NrtA/SsuA/CpmA family ABC transporter substrate-binding protein [Chloroflexi bacterium]|nr:NrtA/SsuA/CpmA family ABC transporter substrate-binding protein [Chloroflexota bacterium]